MQLDNECTMHCEVLVMLLCHFTVGGGWGFSISCFQVQILYFIWLFFVCLYYNCPIKIHGGKKCVRRRRQPQPKNTWHVSSLWLAGDFPSWFCRGSSCSGSQDLRPHESHLSVCISEVGVVAGAFHVVRWLGLVGDQTQEAATSFNPLSSSSLFLISRTRSFPAGGAPGTCTCWRSCGPPSSRRTSSGRGSLAERSWASRSQTACCLGKRRRQTAGPPRGRWRKQVYKADIGQNRFWVRASAKT